MKTLAFVVVGSIALLGCKKKEETAGGGDRCTSAINSAIDSMLSKGKGGAAPPPMVEIGNKLRVIMTERCKADGWPDAVITCFAAATDQPSMKACRTQLPEQQAQRLQGEIIKVMSGAMRPGGPGDGQGPHDTMGGPSGSAASNPPPAGSDVPATGSGVPTTGSAGSATH